MRKPQNWEPHACPLLGQRSTSGLEKDRMSASVVESGSSNFGMKRNDPALKIVAGSFLALD
jgi:hypothetical protein